MPIAGCVMKERVVLAIFHLQVCALFDKPSDGLTVTASDRVAKRSNLPIVPSIDVQWPSFRVDEKLLDGLDVTFHRGLVQVFRRRRRRVCHLLQCPLRKLTSLLELFVPRDFRAKSLLHQRRLRHRQQRVRRVIDRHGLRELQRQRADEIDRDPRQNLEHHARGLVLGCLTGARRSGLLLGKDREAHEDRGEHQVAEVIVPTHFGHHVWELALKIQEPIDLELEVGVRLRKRRDPKPRLPVERKVLGVQTTPRSVQAPIDWKRQESWQTAAQRVHIHDAIKLPQEALLRVGVVLVFLLDFFDLWLKQLHHGGASQLVLLQRIKEQLDEESVRHDGPSESLLDTRLAQLRIDFFYETRLNADEPIPPIVGERLVVHRIDEDHPVCAEQVLGVRVQLDARRRRWHRRCIRTFCPSGGPKIQAGAMRFRPLSDGGGQVRNVGVLDARDGLLPPVPEP
mmetsp:Transcript_38077/g.104803  ORF Transcript_38077/g.104803 Transcript_38077/m.104803 type:complete len:454 (-) Transcript_38077:670-2031(-)